MKAGVETILEDEASEADLLHLAQLPGRGSQEAAHIVANAGAPSRDVFCRIAQYNNEHIAELTCKDNETSLRGSVGCSVEPRTRSRKSYYRQAECRILVTQMNGYHSSMRQEQ